MRKKTSILTVSLLCLMLVSPLAEAEELAKDYQLSRAIDLVKALGLYNEGLEDKRK